MSNTASPIPRSIFSPRFPGIAVCVLLLAIFSAISWTSWLGKCATFDEPLHFMGAWIQTHYHDFRCNPEDPPLWKFFVAAETPKDELSLDQSTDLWKQMLDIIPAPAVHYVIQTMYHTPANAKAAEAVIRSGRVRMLFLGVILGAMIAWWAWRLRGPLAAVVAAAAFCFDPNFLAHSPLIKNDVAITLVFVLLMAAIWLVGERATIPRIIGVMLLVGVALTTKFSGILAIPMLAIALLCRILIPTPWPFLRWTLKSRLTRFAAAVAFLVCTVLIGYVCIWACYGFRFGPTANPSDKFNYYSPILYTAESEILLSQDPVPVYLPHGQMQEWVTQWKPSAMVRAIKSADKKRLLPQTWLVGFLYTYGTSLCRRTFLCGEISAAGWWYYFPMAMLFKTPLATLVGLVIAAFFWFRAARFIPNRDWWPLCAILIAPVFYMAVAMHGHLNIGIRHIFPVYPFLFIFLGVMAASAYARRPKIATWIISILLLGLIAETGAAYPNFIPFFNVAAGGSQGGLDLLSDSNLDWGQDLPALAAWQRKNPNRQMYLCHFGLPDPRFFGLHYIEMDGSQVPEPDEKTATPGFLPVYAISAVALQGPYLTLEQQSIFKRFLKEKPAEIINGCFYLYDNLPPP